MPKSEPMRQNENFGKENLFFHWIRILKKLSDEFAGTSMLGLIVKLINKKIEKWREREKVLMYRLDLGPNLNQKL